MNLRSVLLALILTATLIAYTSYAYFHRSLPEVPPVSSRERYNGEQTFKSMSSGRYLYIYTDRAYIALDFIEFPRLRGNPSDHEIDVLYAPIRQKILELLKESGGKFIYYGTQDLAGIFQTVGIVVLHDGRSLQEVLIADGLVRFNRDWNPRNYSFLNPSEKALLDRLTLRWLARDQEALQTQRGYWKQHYDLMHYTCDDAKKS